jgi:PAS domain S-box-containing protein
MVESVRDYAIFRLDPDGRVTTWNAGAERIEGYRAEEIIGKHFSIFYPPEAAKRGQAHVVLRMAVDQGRVEDEGWRIRKDGSRFWANVVVTALRDPHGKLVGFAKVSRDLSERKRREDARTFLDRATVTLASSLDVSETLAGAARLAVPELADCCLVDLANDRGRLAQAAAAHRDAEKEALAQRLGRELVPELGLTHGAQCVFRTGVSEVHPELDDATWAAELLGTEFPELLRELGTLSYICVPIRFRGRIQGVLNLLRGSPPRRYTAGDLELAEEFAARVGLAIENAGLFREAQEAVRMRDEFLQIASHELKTPLTPLQLQLDMLSRTLTRGGGQNDFLMAKVAMAHRQTARLCRLVESLLDVTRITRGQMELQLEEVDLGEVVHEVVERFDMEAKNAGCELVVHAEVGVIGQWDRLRLDRVLSNLLSNAIKYGAGKPIEISIQSNDSTARFSVADHGIGIDQQALQRIFDRFERAVSLRHYGGLGLGLFITRQIVEAHGGTVVVQSHPNQGSVFTVVLPCQGATLGLESGNDPREIDP